jgi:hypothetical protein
MFELQVAGRMLVGIEIVRLELHKKILPLVLMASAQIVVVQIAVKQPVTRAIMIMMAWLC